MPRPNHEIRLARRPSGAPAAGDLQLVATTVAEPTDGRVLVRNVLQPVTAAVWSLLTGAAPPLPAYTVGAPLFGPALGEVVESADPGARPGDLVVHPAGWREWALLDAAAVRVVDAAALPNLPAHLAQGLPGYAGLSRLAGLRPGETVFVSGAAGAVGSLAGQVARLLGAGRVVGSAGSTAKAAWLVDDLGLDAAFDRTAGPAAALLAGVAPDGVDVCVDTVGGAQLDAAIAALRPGGRAVLCGALARQLGDEPGGGARDLLTIIGKGLTLHGYSGPAHRDLAPEWTVRFGSWLRSGEITFPHVVVGGGLAAAPGALVDLLRGAYRGAVFVAL